MPKRSQQIMKMEVKNFPRSTWGNFRTFGGVSNKIGKMRPEGRPDCTFGGGTSEETDPAVALELQVDVCSARFAPWRGTADLLTTTFSADLRLFGLCGIVG